ncbi:MAG: DUF2461 domain-containing protein [Clostridia bacterium]|nr:DUF2461 domain-containing protein [Clostridia bacterium]
MFSSKTLKFLAENRGMNSREWFEAHRGEYEEYLQKPLRELAEALAPTVAELDGQIIVTPISKSLSRIWCDVRFSKGMLYRESQWVSFKRDKHEFERYPEFFMVFTSKDFFYGCGYYCASADAMESARRLILSGHESFLKAKAVIDGQERFFDSGDRYKRSKYPEYSEEMREWLDRKNFCFMRRPDIKELFAPDLAETLKADFKMLKPLYDFFITAETLAKMEGE